MEKFRPIKRWGQNFLKDKNIVTKIIEIADLHQNDSVLEIGPGQGILTEAMAKEAREVIAVEIDKKLTALLTERLKDYKNVKIIQGDFLKIDLSTLNLKADTKVVGNLPYYITTPIIMKLLETPGNITRIVVMVQKEVAERIVATSGNKNYGILSIIVQYFADVCLARNISKKVFFPEPKVSSSILKIDIRKKPRIKVKDEKLFFKVVKGAFSQRRKILINCLSPSLDLDKNLIQQALEKSSISPTRRGETLTLEEFGKLSDAISEI